MKDLVKKLAELFSGLDGIISEAHRDKIEEIITLRWGRLAADGLVHPLAKGRP